MRSDSLAGEAIRSARFSGNPITNRSILFPGNRREVSLILNYGRTLGIKNFEEDSNA